MDERSERFQKGNEIQKSRQTQKEVLTACAVFLIGLFISNGGLCSEPYHFRNQSAEKPRQSHWVQGPALKIPYRSKWVSRVKKGGVFKYKRREFASPLVVDDVALIGTGSGRFYAMKKSSGDTLWRFKAEGAISSKPAVQNGRVFFGDDEGNFYAVNLENGKEAWSVNLDAEILTAPAIRGEQIFVATVEGRVVSLSAGEGTILWDKQHSARPLQMTIRGNSTPVLDSAGNLYVGFSDGIFWSLASKTGNLLWEKKIELAEGFHDLDGTPLIEGDRIYLSGFDGPLVAMNRQGRVLWSVPIGSAGPILSSDQLLYLSDSQGSLVAVQKKDGATLWKTKIGDGALTAPVLYKDLLAVGLSSSTMNFVDATSGRLMFRRFAKKGISSDPFLEGDQLFYLSNGGRLYSLKMLQ